MFFEKLSYKYIMSSTKMSFVYSQKASKRKLEEQKDHEGKIKAKRKRGKKGPVFTTR